MAVSNEISKNTVVASGETVTTTTYDRVSADLLMLAMMRAEIRAKYSGSVSGVVAFDREVKTTVLFPFSQV